MFQIMTDGLVLSRHETRAEAESAMATARAESLAEAETLRAKSTTEAERLLDEADEAEIFANSFTIESA